MIGDGADMTVRAARGDDHAIGHGTLVCQVDADHVLGLVVIKPGENQFLQNSRCQRVGTVFGRGLGLAFMRV